MMKNKRVQRCTKKAINTQTTRLISGPSQQLIKIKTAGRSFNKSPLPGKKIKSSKHWTGWNVSFDLKILLWVYNNSHLKVQLIYIKKVKTKVKYFNSPTSYISSQAKLSQAGLTQDTILAVNLFHALISQKQEKTTLPTQIWGPKPSWKPLRQDHRTPAWTSRLLKAAAGGLHSSPTGHACHRLGTLACSPLPEKLSQVEISFLARLILTWIGSLTQLTPLTYACSVTKNWGLGKDHFSELPPQSVCGTIVQTAGQITQFYK